MSYSAEQLQVIIDRMQPRCAVCHEKIQAPKTFIVVDAVASLGKEIFYHTTCAPFTERGWGPSVTEKKLRKALEEISVYVAPYNEAIVDDYLREIISEALS